MRWCHALSVISIATVGGAGWGQHLDPERRYLWTGGTDDRANDGSWTKTNHFTELVASQNATIRYKAPGLCETTPGVRSFSGFVDLNETSHSFFWFFEARHNPETAPITLWLNGGPGSDSLMGLFQEIGPCSVVPDLNTTLNPFSWTEVSNLLFLSQPLGVGFSYASSRSNASPESIPVAIDRTDVAADAVWQIVQAFLAKLPEIDARVKSRVLNLWTESYGGHYGPSFFRHFHTMNEQIKKGTREGVRISLGTLGIGNGIIDGALQFPSYPRFAAENTYGIRAINDTVSNYMTFACHMSNGCLDQVFRCNQAFHSNRQGHDTAVVCSEAANMCRDNVEGPFYQYSGRNMYDIRRAAEDPVVSDSFVEYLNLPSTRKALGVDGNSTYEASSVDVYWAFQHSGDYVYPSFREDIEFLLERDIRIVLTYGDADYIGNWIGGEAVSLALNYSHAAFFRASPYRLLRFGEGEVGKVREHGNLSFAVIYGAGHFTAADQPSLALELFRRSVDGVDLATGRTAVGNSTIPFVPDSPVSAALSTRTAPAGPRTTGSTP